MQLIKKYDRASAFLFGSIWLAVYLTFAGPVMAQNAKTPIYMIDGKISGLDSGKVYLYYKHNGRGVIDSSVIRNSIFQLKGNIDLPTEASLSLRPLWSVPDYDNMIDLYIEPRKMELSVALGKFKAAKLNGSLTDADRYQLARMTAAVRAETNSATSFRNNIYRSYKKAIDDSAHIQAKVLKIRLDSMTAVIRPLSKKRDSIERQFMMDHPTSFVTANKLLMNINVGTSDIATTEYLYNKFPEVIKQSEVGKEIALRLQKGRRLPIGHLVKNFSAVTSERDTISLSDYKGKKYVLLDFWASWCLPCRRLVPDLKALHQQYGDELEIIGVSREKSKEAWQKALEQDGTEWPEIFEQEGASVNEASKFISKQFEVQGIPVLYLIDKEGKLIKKFGSNVGSLSIYDLNDEITTILKGDL